MKKNKENHCDLEDTFNRNNVQIISAPEEGMEKGVESLFKEIIAENFPNLG